MAATQDRREVIVPVNLHVQPHGLLNSGRDCRSSSRMLASLTRQTAGLPRRLAALAYDWLLLIALMFGFTFFVILVRGGEAVEPASWWFNASLVVISFAFFGWFWTHGGQTLGMRAWKLRLERDDGSALRWPDAARRFASSWVLALPPGLGFLWGAFDREGLCWHDRLSRTRIVRV